MPTHPPQLGADGEFDADLPSPPELSVSAKSKAKLTQRQKLPRWFGFVKVLIGAISIPIISLVIAGGIRTFQAYTGQLPCDHGGRQAYSDEWLATVNVRLASNGEFYAYQSSGRRFCHLSRIASNDDPSETYWSPNQRYTAVLVWFSQFYTDSRLFVLDTETHQLRQAIDYTTAYATWSPDSRFLIHGNGYDGYGDVMRIDLSTFEKELIISGEAMRLRVSELKKGFWLNRQTVILQIGQSWTETCKDRTAFYMVNIDTLEQELIVDDLCQIDNVAVHRFRNVLTWGQHSIESCTLSLDTREITCEPAPTDVS